MIGTISYDFVLDFWKLWVNIAPVLRAECECATVMRPSFGPQKQLNWFVCRRFEMVKDARPQTCQPVPHFSKWWCGRFESNRITWGSHRCLEIIAGSGACSLCLSSPVCWRLNEPWDPSTNLVPVFLGHTFLCSVFAFFRKKTKVNQLCSFSSCFFVVLMTIPMRATLS